MSTFSGLRQLPAARTSTSASPGLLQRCGSHPCQPGSCTGASQEETLRRRPGGAPGQAAVPGTVQTVLTSPGVPLERSAQELFEPRFGHDFSRVRVHADQASGASATAVGALAYTVGWHIVFAPGRYAPQTDAGRKLLAHELSHVTQQRPAAQAPSYSRLTIGSTADPLEAEADQMAEMAVSGPVAAPLRTGHPAPAVVRRTPDESAPLGGASPAAPTATGSGPGAATIAGGGAPQQPTTTAPQRPGEEREISLPPERRGQATVIPYVTRRLVPCPCRKVPEARTGGFWNPELGNFVVVYRHCKGDITADLYASLRSNLPSTVSSGASPEGTVRAGADVNVSGTSRQGRIQLEILGTNEPAGTAGTRGAIPGGTPGVGGHAQVVYQSGNRWVLFLDAEYVRRLGSLPGGTDPNQWQLGLGGKYGDVTARAGISLGGGQPSGGIPIAGVTIEGHFGGSIPHARQEECYACLCPAAARTYECRDVEEDHAEPEPPTAETPLAREFRYYFKLDQAEPEPTLLAESQRNLGELDAEVHAGGTIELIRAYASPEATEQHNKSLSERRAKQMASIVRDTVGPAVPLPAGQPSGGGELLGRRSLGSLSSPLLSAINAAGFRSAEDLTPFLFGPETPDPELAPRFISLFGLITEPAARLELFGLTADDPIAPDVLGSIDSFVRARGRGPRPWERFFRLLRVGIVRVREKKEPTEQKVVPHPGPGKPVEGDECAARGKRAETAPGFGPIDPLYLRPTSTPQESARDCDDAPSAADTKKGCKYDPSPTQTATAPNPPERAPTPLGQGSLRMR
jgi:Domain of unknown function (DUF4157)